MTASSTVAVEPTVYEYTIRVKVAMPADIDKAELDKAMREVLDNEGAAESIEDALYYEFDFLSEIMENNANCGVLSFEMDPQ